MVLLVTGEADSSSSAAAVADVKRAIHKKIYYFFSATNKQFKKTRCDDDSQPAIYQNPDILNP